MKTAASWLAFATTASGRRLGAVGSLTLFGTVSSSGGGGGAFYGGGGGASLNGNNSGAGGNGGAGFALIVTHFA
jgi:hypothetical protein